MKFKLELDKILTENGKTYEDIAYAKVWYQRWSNEFNKTLLYKTPTGPIKWSDDVALFEYDNGYGWQEIYGFVVFTDGSWLERHEYDGSEWWVYKKTPLWLEWYEE